jgi:hypothetical protein
LTALFKTRLRESLVKLWNIFSCGGISRAMVAALRQEEDDGHAQQQQVHWEDRDYQVLLFKKIKFKKNYL